MIGLIGAKHEIAISVVFWVFVDVVDDGSSRQAETQNPLYNQPVFRPNTHHPSNNADTFVSEPTHEPH